MKVYVAAKWEEKAAAREAMAALQAYGHTITHDWTAEDDAGMEGAALQAYLAKCARLDVKGVMGADAIVVLHHDKLCGGLVELGMGIATCDLVIVVGAAGAKVQPIFYKLPEVTHVATIDQAVRLLTVAAVRKAS